METFISEQVANDSCVDVINFRKISIELLAPNVSKYQRSNIRSRKYLVIFEITLSADESVETHNQLTNVLSQIENFEPDSLVIVSQKSITEESEFIDKSGIQKLDFFTFRFTIGRAGYKNPRTKQLFGFKHNRNK